MISPCHDFNSQEAWGLRKVFWYPLHTLGWNSHNKKIINCDHFWAKKNVSNTVLSVESIVGWILVIVYWNILPSNAPWPVHPEPYTVHAYKALANDSNLCEKMWLAQNSIEITRPSVIWQLTWNAVTITTWLKSVTNYSTATQWLRWWYTFKNHRVRVDSVILLRQAVFEWRNKIGPICRDPHWWGGK